MSDGNEGGVEDRLTNLRSLTDAALIQLDVDGMLGELLVRVREILDADTAAVLLVDSDSQDLVARAARGIEEEVRQGVRVPLGTGFAGRVAATRGPIRLDRIDETTVANPLLWEKGIKVMLGVPLLSQDDVLGVLHVGRLDQRAFLDEDIELLQVVAERVTSALQARQLAVEQAAAGLLERSLLPGLLPNCPGFEFAARYAPAENRIVGGDWYDLFLSPSGQLWIVIGDVAGHGLNAAVIMGRIRSAFRAYAMLDEPPERVLDLVDRKVRHFEIGTFATMTSAVAMPPDYDTLTIAVAGHPPPVVVVPREPAALVPIDVNAPLGVGQETPRTATRLPIAPGTVVAFYTDGLIERRGETLDIGLERLRAAVEAAHPNRVARQIMHDLLVDTIPRDDIALVVIRRTGGSQ